MFKNRYSNIYIKGFTLVELLVTVAMVGVLSMIVIATLNPPEQSRKGRDAERKSSLFQMQSALEAYNSDNNKYPDAENGHIKGGLWGNEWMPYMAKVPKDPLSPTQDYFYEVASDNSWYKLYAKLERCSSDTQVISGTDCSTDNYSYAVASSNISIASGNPPPPGATAVPTPPGASPTPTPTTAPGATSTPTPTRTPPTPTRIPTPTIAPIPTFTPTPSPTLTPIFKRIFRSSGKYTGDLLNAGKSFDPSVNTGLEGADAICQGLAVKAKLGGIWKAWLSDSNISAASRLNKSEFNYKLADGTTLIANNWDDLTTVKENGWQYLRGSINKNEKSLPEGNTAWTFTNPNGSKGSASGSSDCSNWRSSSSSFYTQFGYTGIGADWTNYDQYMPCNIKLSLYCFEQ